MEKYLNLIADSFSGYFYYLLEEVTSPSWNNYFYWLLFLSLLVWFLEILIPWRKDQKIFRKGFWLDTFYIFFNFFLFSLVGYHAISNIAVNLFGDFLALLDIDNVVAVEVAHLPVWLQLLIMFVVADFIHWNIHRELHRRTFLWEFHKVHHAVKELGFGAQFRFHFMETIIYKSIQYLPLAMIGFGIQEFIIVHMAAVFIGHLNHANVNWDYGILKYVFNNPKMHIWHHSKAVNTKGEGVNFAISLSLWDYLFKTNYIPGEGRDIELGFSGDEDFPEHFKGQVLVPFKRTKELISQNNKYNED